MAYQPCSSYVLVDSLKACSPPGDPRNCHRRQRSKGPDYLPTGVRACRVFLWWQSRTMGCGSIVRTSEASSSETDAQYSSIPILAFASQSTSLAINSSFAYAVQVYSLPSPCTSSAAISDSTDSGSHWSRHLSLMVQYFSLCKSLMFQLNGVNSKIQGFP